MNVFEKGPSYTPVLSLRPKRIHIIHCRRPDLLPNPYVVREFLLAA